MLSTAHLLARLYREADDPSAARRVLEEAFAAGERRWPHADPLMLALAFELGSVADELGNRHEARRNYTRVAAAGPAVLGADHPAVRIAREYLGDAAPAPQPVVLPAPHPGPAGRSARGALDEPTVSLAALSTLWQPHDASAAAPPHSASASVSAPAIDHSVSGGPGVAAASHSPGSPQVPSYRRHRSFRWHRRPRPSRSHHRSRHRPRCHQLRCRRSRHRPRYHRQWYRSSRVRIPQPRRLTLGYRRRPFHRGFRPRPRPPPPVVPQARTSFEDQSARPVDQVRSAAVPPAPMVPPVPSVAVAGPDGTVPAPSSPAAPPTGTALTTPGPPSSGAAPRQRVEDDEQTGVLRSWPAADGSTSARSGAASTGHPEWARPTIRVQQIGPLLDEEAARAGDPPVPPEPAAGVPSPVSASPAWSSVVTGPSADGSRSVLHPPRPGRSARHRCWASPPRHPGARFIRSAHHPSAHHRSAHHRSAHHPSADRRAGHQAGHHPSADHRAGHHHRRAHHPSADHPSARRRVRPCPRTRLTGQPDGRPARDDRTTAATRPDQRTAGLPGDHRGGRLPIAYQRTVRVCTADQRSTHRRTG